MTTGTLGGRPLSATGKLLPTFRRVGNDLRSAIPSGQFPPAVALPTEAQIATPYSVSRQTVRRAFQDLVAESLVFRGPGRGTFATPADGRYLRHFGSVEDLMGLSADTQMQVLISLSEAIHPTAADRLRLPDDHVGKTTFRRLHHQELFSHPSVYLPPLVWAQLGEVKELAMAGSWSHVTLIGLLDRVLAVPIQGRRAEHRG